MTRQRGILFIAGALVLLGPPVLWIVASIPANPTGTVLVPVERTAHAEPPADQLATLAARDPMGLVRLGRQRYDEAVRSYRCTLVKQERLGDRLSPVKEIELRFREQPFAVYMLWQKNAGDCRRALHERGPAYLGKQGEPLARVEPAGAVARLFVKDIMLPIHGPEARKASRRFIDEAGFRATFELLEKFNGIAAERGTLDLRFSGTGKVDGRPTYVITRTLPYTGPEGLYPDARMILHLDQEWLLPVAVYSYADTQEQTLLGSYVFTNVELNPAFDPDAFQF